MERSQKTAVILEREMEKPTEAPEAGASPGSGRVGETYVPQQRRASLLAQSVKDLPAMQETWVQSLGQEDPLDEGMASHSRIVA